MAATYRTIAARLLAGALKSYLRKIIHRDASHLNVSIMSTKDLRDKWRDHCERCDRIYRLWVEADYPRVPFRFLPDIPADISSLRCGAKTRAGTPCKQQGIYINGRCKLHGGLSTGPITEDGKRRASQNGKCPKQKRTP